MNPFFILRTVWVVPSGYSIRLPVDSGCPEVSPPGKEVFLFVPGDSFILMMVKMFKLWQ